MNSTVTLTPNFFSGAGRQTSLLRLLRNKFLTGLCIFLSLLTLIPLLSIIILLLQKGMPLLGPNLFTQLPPAPGQDGGGFGNAVVGTLAMVGISLIFSVPLGIFAAVYVNEYAPVSNLASAVRFVAKLLTGIPSIICGVFAFAAIVMTTHKFSALAGGIALSILILPTILLTAEQALMGVPYAYREASFGVGATPFQTIWRIVLPEASPAMMTGIMLAVARASGETAPVLFTALFSYNWIHSLMEPTASLSVLIFNFAALPYSHHVAMAWTASLVLVTLVTVTNVAAQVIFRPKHQ
ncbi:MAG: phosphate ABC transporter permease PstA [bacterium]